MPGWFPTLGKFWTDHGFVFFVPHRGGHGRSPGAYIVDEQQKFAESEKDPVKAREHTIHLHERANLDVVAALVWLREQPFVARDKCVVAGISYGGIQTLLTAEKGLEVKAFVAFSPAAMSWKGNPLLRDRLLTAIRQAPAPVFLLQAQNDYNLGPMELLGEKLKSKGAPNRAKLYPVFGDKDNPKDGHGGFAVRGAEIWGADVLEFVAAAVQRQ
jgi:carboxymethylenebutenolidase